MPIRDLQGDLRVVDLLEDDGIRAVSDEGCNTTCHSKAWRLHAEEKYLKMGYCVEWQQADKAYHGVGDKPTKASLMYMLPLAVDTRGYCRWCCRELRTRPPKFCSTCETRQTWD